MLESFDLTKLDPRSFEHLVNVLALRVLGAGHTGFGPGPDGGRDGYFQGEAPYPSQSEKWRGRWYIQSKFHKPHLSQDAQKWLISQVQDELEAFAKSNNRRIWPDVWIVATNIEPSGAPMTGAFDRCLELVAAANPALANRFHIWGGEKIVGLLTHYPDVAASYAHFLTPGHTLTAITAALTDAQASVETILRYFVVKEFSEQQYTRLDQAGSTMDSRPGIHKLFIDLPFLSAEFRYNGMIMQSLVRTATKSHRSTLSQAEVTNWRSWNKLPWRARVLFVRGGPGQGKSTIGQYFSQIQRACIILEGEFNVLQAQQDIAVEIRDQAHSSGVWPVVPRVPVIVELREYARWFGSQKEYVSRGILTYLASRISQSVEQVVLAGTIKRALSKRSWLVIFDGLDEVPQDVKEAVASEVCGFVNEVCVANNADLLAICTSRPQGYSGQFSQLDGPTIDLTSLSPAQALQCAKPVIELDRSKEEADKAYEILASAMVSGSIRELMTTPLQAHIMAVVVRDGGKPPERRWQLFSNFYEVIRRREANRNLPDQKIAELLRGNELLLKTVHSHLGFVLHARAEKSDGAQTNLSKAEFHDLAKRVVEQLQDSNINSTTEVLQRAAKERLVLVSTPDDGNHVRFDIRPLQEFFAAEFLYENVAVGVLQQRLEIIAGDAHWREVMYYVLSALVENGRQTELTVAIEVLERLNEDTGDAQFRVLERRLGRGASLAARLLQEGVLEHDKRIRQQFRKCLEPLASSTDPNLIDVLLRVKQTNSKAWLLNFLVDTLREASSSESIGAAMALSCLLTDDDEHVAEVQRIFSAAPTSYISHVFFARYLRYIEVNRRTSDQPDEFPIQEWLLSFMLRFLLSPQWKMLSARGLEHCLYLLSDVGERTIEVGKSLGLSTIQLDLLYFLLGIGLKRGGHEPLEDFGLLRGSFYKFDWTTGMPEIKHLEGDVLGEVSDEASVLQVAYKILHFMETKSLASLKALLEVTLFDTDGRFVLPNGLLAFVPRLGSLANVAPGDIQEANELSLKQLSESSNLGRALSSRPYEILALGEECNKDQWLWCLNNLPEVALNIWNMTDWRHGPSKGRPEILDSEEGIKALLNTVLENPHMLAGNVNSWARLIGAAGELEQKLRAVMKSFATSSFTAPDTGSSFCAFSLDLPEEACLLPQIIVALSPAFNDALDNPLLSDSSLSVNKDESLDAIGTAANFKNIADNVDQNSNVRAAAALLYLAHGNTDVQSLSAYRRLLLDAYVANQGSDYLDVLLNVLLLKGEERSAEVKSFVAGLLEAAREDYEGRSQIDLLLRHWREEAYAPIHAAGVEKLWLTNGS